VDGKAKLLDELSPEVAEAPMTLSSDQASAPSPDEEIKTLHNYAAAAVTASPEELTEALSTLSVDGKAKLLDELSPEATQAPKTTSPEALPEEDIEGVAEAYVTAALALAMAEAEPLTHATPEVAQPDTCTAAQPAVEVAVVEEVAKTLEDYAAAVGASSPEELTEALSSLPADFRAKLHDALRDCDAPPELTSPRSKFAANFILATLETATQDELLAAVSGLSPDSKAKLLEAL